MDDFQIPKGATAVASNPPTTKTDSDFQLPKGAVPVGASTPNFGPAQQSGKPQSTAAEFQIPKGATPVSDTHVDKLMSYLREPAAKRQQIYDYTVGAGGTIAFTPINTNMYYLRVYGNAVGKLGTYDLSLTVAP